jgi:molybdopterin/thiamine biosynthesis adenylyltransferase
MIPTPEAIYLDPYWEILFLACGDILFNHLYGQELRLRSPSPKQRTFLEELGMASDHPFDLRVGSVSTKNLDPELLALAQLLAHEKVVFPANALRSVEELSAVEFQRFRSFLAWLGQFSNEPYGTASFRRLRNSTVGIIGVGGAGSLSAAMLAACGIGHLKIVDGDYVEPSNLVRQILYTEHHASASIPKVVALETYLRAFSSFTKVTPTSHALQNEDEFSEFVAGCDLVILTADQPRVLINRQVNRVCVSAEIPLLYCFVDRVGPIYIPRRSACFECLEQEWRAESGADYDVLVMALQSRTRVEYPSMISGPVQVADVLVSESLGLLSEAYVPRTINRMVRLGAETSGDIQIPKKSDCIVCGHEMETCVAPRP